MGLETGTRITDLVSTNPTATDLRSQGDDHIRLLKTILKTEVIALLGSQAKANLSVASGVITVPALHSALIFVVGEGGVADNLDTITGAGTHDGMLICIAPGNAAYPVTLKHGTGNLFLLRAKDAVLDGAGENILLIYYSSLWIEIFRGDISEVLNGDTLVLDTLTATTLAATTLTATTTTPGALSGWPSAWAWRSTALAAQDFTTATEILLNAVIFNVGSCFAVANGRFTPNVAGKYLVVAQLLISNVGTPGVDVGQIRKNGAATSGNYVEWPFVVHPTASVYGVQLHGIFDMNGTTDYLSAWIDLELDTGVDFANGAHSAYMKISRIG